MSRTPTFSDRASDPSPTNGLAQNLKSSIQNVRNGEPPWQGRFMRYKVCCQHSIVKTIFGYVLDSDVKPPFPPPLQVSSS